MNYCYNRIQKLYAKWDKYEREWGESFEDYYSRKEAEELRLIKYAERLHSSSKEGKLKLKYFMITIRPKSEDVTFETFKEDVELFVSELPYKELEYCFEQKGESLFELGKGFHVHIIFSTDKINYWQSHVLRDVKKKKYGFLKYTKPNCIQVDKILCIVRAKEYIRGIKNDEDKELSCEFDVIWREQLGLLDVFSDTRSSP